MLDATTNRYDIFFSGLISLYRDIHFPNEMRVVGTIHGLRELEVTFDSCLRERVRQIFSEMHRDMARGHTPRVKPSKACQACSLKPICLPRLMKHHDVGAYYANALGRET